MFETYRMLGRERELELKRLASRRRVEAPSRFRAEGAGASATLRELWSRVARGRTAQPRVEA